MARDLAQHTIILCSVYICNPIIEIAYQFSYYLCLCIVTIYVAIMLHVHIPRPVFANHTINANVMVFKYVNHSIQSWHYFINIQCGVLFSVLLLVQCYYIILAVNQDINVNHWRVECKNGTSAIFVKILKKSWTGSYNPGVIPVVNFSPMRYLFYWASVASALTTIAHFSKSWLLDLYTILALCPTMCWWYRQLINDNQRIKCKDISNVCMLFCNNFLVYKGLSYFIVIEHIIVIVVYNWYTKGYYNPWGCGYCYVYD